MDPVTATVLAIGAGAMAVLGTVLMPKPKAGGTKAPAEFQIPEASNGVRVPYLAGTYQCTPNIVYYGGYHVTSQTSGGKKSKTTTETAWLTHVHVLTMGVTDQIVKIMADDDQIFPVTGSTPRIRAVGEETIYLTTKLGRMLWAWGTPTQTWDGYTYWPAAPAGFRNICYASHQDSKLNDAFLVPRMTYVLLRKPVAPLTAPVMLHGGVNPAHVIWEILTSGFAGSRYSPADLDLDAFETLAQRLADENVGCNCYFTGESQDDILKKFIAEFDIVFRVRNGLISPVAIRDDLDVGSLPTINESNATNITRRRAPMGSEPNDVTFEFTNAGREYRKDTVEIMNLGSLNTLGRRQMTPIELTLVTTASTSAVVAARKMRQLNTPADTFDATVQPSLGCRLELGDGVIVQSSRLGVQSMVCRVIQMRDPDEGGFPVTLQEDVYHSADAAFTSDDGTIPTIPPLAKALRQKIVELPYQLAGGEELALTLLFQRGSQSQTGAILYTSPDDAEYTQAVTVTGYAATGVLVTDYPETFKIDRTIGFIIDADNADIQRVQNVTEGQFQRHQQLALIGDEIISVHFIAPVAGGTTAGGRWAVYGIIRGLADTEQIAHAAGTEIYFFSSQETVGPSVDVAIGNAIYMKAQPYGQGLAMNLDDVDAAGPYTITGRAFAPLSVVNLKANGRFVLPTYSADIQLTFDYRVRDAGAGVGIISTGLLYTDTPHQGVFVIRVLVGGVLKRTAQIDTDDTYGTGWTYTAAMNAADNGGLAGEITFQVFNRYHLHFSPARIITVRLA